MSNTQYRLALLTIILLSLMLRIYILWLNVWPINGDEAQYWSWAKHLDWGYYSKPPMVAWIIALTTHFFGNGAVGMRIGSSIAYAINSIFIYLTGKALFNVRVGFWAALIFLFIPGVIFSSSIISTDPFLLMFWSIALFGLVNALKNPNKLDWWLFTAIVLGAAFYSKYAAILFTISLFVYLLISNKNRKLLKTLGPYLILIIPVIMLIPNLYWNYQNHFASIVAVKNNADLSGDLFHFDNLFNFLGSQFAVFGPILFVCLLMILFKFKKFLRDETYLFLIVFTFITLAIMTVESFLSRAHANWSAPAYIAATLLVVAILIEYNRMKWLWAALIFQLILAISFIYIKPLIHTVHAPMDKKMTIISWPTAAKEINNLRSQYPDTQILVKRRMLLTQIMYFANVPLKKIYAWNPKGLIQNQYDLVTNLRPEVGKDFLLFTYNYYIYDVMPYFKSNKLIKTINLNTIDNSKLTLYIYLIKNFKGY